MAYVINKIKAGSTTYNIASTAYATCDTTASTVAKVAYISGTSASSGVTLTQGLTIHVKFTYTNTAANPTLSVNGTTAKAIKCCGTTAAGTTTDTSWFAGETVTLTYDGTYWQLNRNIINLNSLLTYLSTLEQTARDLGILDNSGGGSGGNYNPTDTGYWAAVGPQDLVTGDIVVITAETTSGIYLLTTLTQSTSIKGLLVNPPEDGILGYEFDFQIDESTGIEEVRFIVEWGDDGLIYFLVYPGTDGKYLYNNGGSTNQAGFTYAKDEAGWAITSRGDDYSVFISNPVNNRYLACYPGSSVLWRAYAESSAYVQNNPITIYKWVGTPDNPDPQ